MAISSQPGIIAPGEIYPDVVKYWSDSTDILHYMQRNWVTLGPKLIGKLHVYVGDWDTYYLDRATREVQAWLKTTTSPHYEGFFMYGERKPHCWTGPVSTRRAAHRDGRVSADD